MNRCQWATKSPELMIYHDTRWGKETTDPQQMFQALCLEIMQAGLTFQTVLKYEPGMNAAYDNFSVDFLATLTQADVELFCKDERVIKNHDKILAIIENAKILQKNSADFVSIVWNPVSHTTLDHLLTQSAKVDEYANFTRPIMKDLKQLGFKRVGLVTTYSFLEAIGVVNDHVINCDFR